VSTATLQFDRTSGHLAQSDIEQMSFVELDATITDGLSLVHRSQTELLPFLAEMRERLHAQGKRADLPDTPKGLTWQKWVGNNKHLIGSIRTVNRILAVGKKKNPKPVVQANVDTTITGEYSPSDRSYHARAKIVEWSTDNKIAFEMNLACHAEDPKKEKRALAIQAFRGLRTRMKKFKVWQRELDVEMKKCLAPNRTASNRPTPR
jgi:hypothetical protein